MDAKGCPGQPFPYALKKNFFSNSALFTDFWNRHFFPLTFLWNTVILMVHNI